MSLRDKGSCIKIADLKQREQKVLQNYYHYNDTGIYINTRLQY